MCKCNPAIASATCHKCEDLQNEAKLAPVSRDTERLDRLLAEAGVPRADSEKPTNPKDAVGIRKLAWSCLPWRVIGEAALGLFEGARKYGRHNYRKDGVRGSVYFDATLRHITDWYEGEDIDPDSGLSHITKAICSLMVLRDGMMQGNWVDDRPPRAAAGWVQEMNAKAGEIIDKHPNPKAAFTEK